MTEIERLARAAFAEAWGRYPDDFGPAYEHDAELFEAIVRAVLEKLRKPALSTLEAGYGALARIYPPKTNGGHAIGQLTTFEAMIDAIAGDPT